MVDMATPAPHMPPMPAPGGAMPRPGMPPAGADPGPGDVMAADAARQQEQIAAIAAQAPTPKAGGIPVDVLVGVVESTNVFIGKANEMLAAEADDLPPDSVTLPLVAWEAPKGVRSWDQQIPPEIFMPLVAIAAMVQTTADGKFQKLAFDPTTMQSSGDARAIGARVESLAKNKEFMRAVASAAVADIGAGSMAAEPEPQAVGVPEGAGGKRDALAAAAM